MRKRTYPVERTFNPIIQIKKQNIMATLTVEQIEQKKQLLTEKLKEMKTIYDELVEAGAIELTDEELDAIAGGGKVGDWFKGLEGFFKGFGGFFKDLFTGNL